MKKFILLIILNQSLVGFCQQHFLNTEPDWSPDGNKIVFVSQRDKNDEVYLMNKDGSESIRLTNTKAMESDPSISPDGTKILFLSNRDKVSQIYIMNIDGSNQINITNTKNNEYSPCWSPMGDKIAFQSQRDENSQIYVMDADGSDPKRVSDLAFNNSFPIWSPDGKKLLCQTIRIPDVFKFSIIKLDGDKIESINDPERRIFSSCFSKDNRHVLYHSQEAIRFSEESTSDLFSFDLEKQTSVQLAKNQKNLITADFLDDGNSIVIETSTDIYLYDVITGNKKEIIKNAWSVKCSPKEDLLLFVSGKKKN